MKLWTKQWHTNSSLQPSAQVSQKVVTYCTIHVYTMTKIDGQFQKNQCKSVGGVALTHTYLYLYTCKVFELLKCENSKNNLSIVKKAHAYLQVMIKTAVKYQIVKLSTLVGHFVSSPRERE